ncbi:MAG: hypothetical protein Q8Q37_00490 [bacterium]|nr:hypothetical protein [bacterium]
MNKHIFSFWGILIILVVVIAGGYLIWNKYFEYDPVRVYQEAEQKYIAAMTADTYGGATPQETLDLFVEALRQEDVELASKYFLLDENTSREKWAAKLLSIKDKDLLSKMADDIAIRAVPDLTSKISEEDFKFILWDDDGDVGARLDMQFNGLAKIWKIESF